MEKSLRTRVEVLLKQKKDRKQELKALQEQDRDLCDILCTAPLCLDSNAVPSLEDLDRYRRHLASLSAEKEQRREEFMSRKRQIILLMEELDHTPDTSFERDVVCEDEECFCLSTDNIAALQTLLQQLEARRSRNEAVCTDLRSRIVALWERLQVPAEERQSSAVHTAGSRARVMKAVRNPGARGGGGLGAAPLGFSLLLLSRSGGAAPSSQVRGEQAKSCPRRCGAGSWCW
ncbi:protein regulator of cytokinesis 1-like [Podargus strigoides]